MATGSADYDGAMAALESRLGKLRKKAVRRGFDVTRPAEIETNRFFFDGAAVDRLMVVLRATGCQSYRENYGCSMCGHHEGTPLEAVTAAQYLQQWQGVLSGTALEKDGVRFDMNDYPVLCLYNLGSLLNPNEVPAEAVREIFRSLGSFPGVRKTIIESRAEYVVPAALENICGVYDGLVEVGLGLESLTTDVRELCHHKNLPDIGVFEEAVRTLHAYGFRALAYVNQKPPFLTEKEAIDDAVRTAIYAFDAGADAVSIEPTSLQLNSLADELHSMGLYRVPWLWSVREVARGVMDRRKGLRTDLRLGGYFDEEILSGSQGTAPGVSRNELFPHETAGNCSSCTPRMVSAVKSFNMTYDVASLDVELPCLSCYDLWRRTLAVEDSRPIARRVIDALGGE